MALTYLVTGANRGIGLALVKEIIKDKASTVYAGARVPEKATELNELASKGANIKVIQLDQDDQKSVDALPSKVSSLDVLYLNAAICGGSSSILSAPLEELPHLFNTNVVGTLRVVQALHPKIVASSAEDKKVVFISSTAASMTIKGGPKTYCVSKAAEQMVGRLVADELKEKGVPVALIHPGWVQTDMGGKEASITPEASAEAVVKVAAKVDISRTGSYWSYQGKELPW